MRVRCRVSGIAQYSARAMKMVPNDVNQVGRGQGFEILPPHDSLWGLEILPAFAAEKNHRDRWHGALFPKQGQNTIASAPEEFRFQNQQVGTEGAHLGQTLQAIPGYLCLVSRTDEGSCVSCGEHFTGFGE